MRGNVFCGKVRQVHIKADLRRSYFIVLNLNSHSLRKEGKKIAINFHNEVARFFTAGNEMLNYANRCF